ncbi:GNAT family N-acetyltransferase [Tessaracoccus lacteus]|uniref:GNAT family protein n=1 Tax=Tessaracoccus lacteus TaxID=3041766 RepID=A0ABY8PWA7_9ACTN|nr:GNAT family protein [Tessaracoccus sp. T21]WGT46761.1 GNAT family protein [Tessaracoccus sp. T21]
MRDVETTVLEGHGVRLEPLGPEHAAGLAEAVRDGELWRDPLTSVPSPDEVEGYIAVSTGRIAFAVIDTPTGRVVGSTSYYDVNAAVGRLLVGWTFYAQSSQRTHINTAAKLLLLGHAFDDLGAETVAWRTDSLNLRSRRAIERLGARLDGVIRGDQARSDGSVRDSASYSLTRDEWPTARDGLVGALAAYHV